MAYLNGTPMNNTRVYIFHNTFYDMYDWGLFFNATSEPGFNCEVMFRNNIVVTKNLTRLANFVGPVDADYNCYYSSDPQFVDWNNGYNIYYNLSAWQAGTSYDQHSVYGDPKFVNGFNLASDSPCKDMGADVSGNITFSYVDYDGVSIPQGSAPDAGAYEYS